MGLLDGKVAVVTGGGRGIGRCHALMLAGEGATVLVNDLGTQLTGTGADTGPASEVVAEIVAAGGRAAANTSDIADWSGAKGVIDQAVAEFGRLDILVNNAGITFYDSIETETGEGWARVMGVNLTGSAATMHWAAQYWAAHGPELGRAVVNTASPAGTNPPPGAISYVVSKAGVAALTIAAATELAHMGVRVNAVAPMARTRMSTAIPKLEDMMKVPEGFDRMAPENISRLVRYLVSGDCRFTGRVFGVDGDTIYLYEEMSAENFVTNGGKAWEQADLAAAFEKVPQRDQAYMIAPGLHMRAGSPRQEALDVFARIGNGEVPEPVWTPLLP